MQTVVDILRAELGDELSPELIARVRDGSVGDETLAKLGERYTTWERGEKWKPPQRKQGELRPYIPVHWGRPDWLVGDIGCNWKSFRETGNVWSVVDALKQRLLYCHAVAIDEPGAFILDIFPYLHGSRYGQGTFVRARHDLSNYLEFLYHMRPLIEEGVLVLVSRRASEAAHKGRTGAGVDLVRATKLQGETSLSELAHVPGGRTLEHEWDRVYALQAAEETLMRMAAMSRELQGGVDYYLPYHFWRDVLADILEELREISSNTKEYPESDLQLLVDLCSVPLPGLTRLQPQDIVSVRKYGDEFNKWRTRLKRGLERLEGLKDVDDWKEASRVRLQEEVQEGRRELEEQMSESSFLKSIGGGIKTFAVGGIAGGVGYFASGDWKAGLISAVAGATGDMIVDAAIRLNKKQVSKGLLQHYVAISAAEN